METAGLAVGIIGLAGLFGTCVECFNYIDTGRRYEDDSEILIAKFHIQHVRLYLWGNLVGLTGTSDSENVSILNQQELGVRLCLDGIKRVLTTSKDLIEKYGLVLTEPGDHSGRQETPLSTRADKLRSCLGALLPEHKPSNNDTGVLERVKWVIHEKAKFITLVEDLKDFIDGLHGVVPAIQQRHNRLVERGINSINDNEALELVFEATGDEYPGT